jgi:uncharacterized membrane protein YphA (DoxX/SURF4 family)
MNKVLLALRIVLAGVFLYAGAVKAISSAEFALAILPFMSFPEILLGLISKVIPSAGAIAPEALIGWVASILPPLEIAGAILVLLPWTRRYGAALILLLCLAFIAALGWALANDIIVACSCFGQDEEPSRGKMIIAILRDVALVAMAAFVMLAPNRKRPNLPGK